MNTETETTNDEEQSTETVEVSKEELVEIRHLLSHPRRRLRNDAEYNEDRENRSRSRKGKRQVEEACGKLRDLEEETEA